MMLDEARRISVDVAWREILGRTGSSDLYITIDTDGFSSAYAPGVSAPGADGFAPHEVGPYLRQAAREQQLVAFDVVEVSPPFDADGRTAKLAASEPMHFGRQR